MYSVTGNRSFKGHSGQLFLSNRIPIEYLAFTPLKEAEIGYLRLVLGFVCFKKPMFTFVREGSGSLTTQLKPMKKLTAQGLKLKVSSTLINSSRFQELFFFRHFLSTLECPELVYSFRTALKNCLILLLGSGFTKILETLHTNISTPACCESRWGIAFS